MLARRGSDETPMKVCPSAGPRVRCALALAVGAAALGGCGTPAVVKPLASPLPGLQRDIQAARHAVAQSQQQSSASTVTTP